MKMNIFDLKIDYLNVIGELVKKNNTDMYAAAEKKAKCRSADRNANDLYIPPKPRPCKNCKRISYKGYDYCNNCFEKWEKNKKSPKKYNFVEDDE